MPNAISGLIKVGLIDDHPMVREGVGNVVRETPGVDLAFSSAIPNDAYEFLAGQRLDVLLLDVSLGNDDGLLLIEKFLQIQPDLKIIILTVSDTESFVVKAFAKGASGYLLKESGREQISTAILSASAGIAVLSPGKLLARVFQGWLHTEPSAPSVGPLLTERELEVLRLVAAGQSNKDIADKLFLAESTIKKYSHNAMGKLGTTNRGAAAIRAMRLGLINLEGDDGDDA